MRRKSDRVIVYVSALAISCGLLAIILANQWLMSQSRTVQVASSNQVPMAKVVVARQNIPFGASVKRHMVHEVEWPASAVPSGGFESLDDLLDSGEDGEERVTAGEIFANEPILGSKLAAPGQRATLSSMLPTGRKAISIRVDEVVGVSGFVLPGDRVDILLTRTGVQSDPNNDTQGEQAYTDVVLQNVRVLAIDQKRALDSDDASPARTITVEVSIRDAQKLTLASSIGNLTLVLRDPNNRNAVNDLERITLADLSGDNARTTETVESVALVSANTNQMPMEPSGSERQSISVTVLRATEETTHSVRAVSVRNR